jgi:site-specific DNA-adenine methylase
MKKSVLLIFMLVVILFAGACKSEENEQQNASKNAYQSLKPVSVNADHILTGMSVSEFENLISSDQCISLCGYSFFVDSEERGTVVRFDPVYVTDVKTVSIKKASIENQNKIQKGMDVFSVVETVGIPFQSVTSGICSLDFLTEADTAFRITWDENMRVTDVFNLDG